MIAERHAARLDDRQVSEPPAGAFEQLNDRRRRFVKGLAEGRTIAEAHRRAGYRSRRPWDDGWKLKQQPKVAAALEEVRQQTGLTVEALADSLEGLLQADLADFEPWLLGQKTLGELRDEGVPTHAVRDARVHTNGGRSIALYDRLSAIDLLCKLLGLGAP